MKEINLISIIQASKGLSKAVLESYFNQFEVIMPKEVELNSLELLCKELMLVKSDSKVFDRYFLGYTIPQISKEFDLLRFGKDYIINIELKSEDTGVKIFKQLLRNQYYLGFLDRPVTCFTYVSNENKLYTLDEHQNLTSTSFLDLFKLLFYQEVSEIDSIDRLFNPSNYLVSPFNSTDEFVASKYFLTGHQDEIKLNCLKKFYQKGSTFTSICGKAGTGKSLLTFDIAKECIDKKHPVLIIHCGILNSGHIKLKEEYGWDIIAIKNLGARDLGNYFLVVIDECQRIYPGQLESIIRDIKENQNNCIFSYDRQQCLRQWEVNNNIAKIIEDNPDSVLFELTEKIRTNKEIASFIISLFDRSKPIMKLNRDNIYLSYFQTAQDAKKYLSVLKAADWKIINYTPSNRQTHPYNEYIIHTENTTHEVIGQEFDKVVAVIDHCYYYNGDDLAIRYYTNQPYYHPVKMLFQIMTRTRIKLHIIVINNEEIMERCLSILNANL